MHTTRIQNQTPSRKPAMLISAWRPDRKTATKVPVGSNRMLDIEVDDDDEYTATLVEHCRCGGTIATLGAAALIVVITAWAPSASAGQTCAERDVVVAALAEKYQEAPRSAGLSLQGNLVEILVSPEGTWTLIVTKPSGQTCIESAGNHWIVERVVADEES